jgi:hypothetical protein
LGIWIAVDDQPFTITECRKFQELIKLLNIKVEIPSADTIRNDILNLYKNHRIDLKNKLQVSIFKFIIYHLNVILKFIYY